MTNDELENSDEIMPHMHVYDAFHAETALIPVTRINGITNAIVAPAIGDTLPGQDSFIQMAGAGLATLAMAASTLETALPMGVVVAGAGLAVTLGFPLLMREAAKGSPPAP